MISFHENTQSALSLSSAAALADTTTVNGGTVHFKGEVVNAACAVDAGSVDQTVQLGQVRTASLKQAGATSSAVGFNIQLNDCDTTVATKAAVAFLGTAIDATRIRTVHPPDNHAVCVVNVVTNPDFISVLCCQFCGEIDVSE